MATVDCSKILSDIAIQLSDGISLEQAIHDLWYAAQAEGDWIRDEVYKKVLEVILNNKIKYNNNPEPTKF